MAPPSGSNPPDHPLLPVLRDLAETTPYARGALDVLRLLGLVAVEEGNAVPTGAVAEVMLASLAAHAADRTTARFEWNRLDHTGLGGVDIVRAFEEARVARVPNPTPGRMVRVVQAVIKTRQDGEDAYLLEYDSDARQYQPIGGKWSSQDASLEAALRREIAEELSLAAPPDSQALSLSLLISDWGKTQLSPTFGILTRYSFDFFHATAVRFAISETAGVRWQRRADMLSGRSPDGRAISPILLEALGADRLDALPPSIPAP